MLKPENKQTGRRDYAPADKAGLTLILYLVG